MKPTTNALRENHAAGPYKAGGTLFYYLKDGSTISCNCIGSPFSDQIIEDFDRLRTEIAQLIVYMRSARGHLYAAKVQRAGDDDKIIGQHIDAAHEILTRAIDKAMP